MGWTHTVFGKQASMSGSYLKQIEFGEVSPTFDRLLRIAATLGCTSIEQLVGPLPSEPLVEAHRAPE